MKSPDHLLLCFVLLLFCPLALRGQNFTPSFTPTEKDLFDIKQKESYTFGYLEVLENRAKPNGKTIRLPVYIFKSKSENPQKDPVLYTVGGPGYTTMSSAPYANYYSYLADRDLIFFEQRGTTYAEPHLSCVEWANAQREAAYPGVSAAQKAKLLATAAEACRNRLEAADIDLNTYNTATIAADIEDLRKALNIEKWNLLSLSYSTKIAQVLMRDYPAGIRSVVMDSPLPLEVNYEEETISNMLLVLDQILADCASNEACSTAFPDLRDRFIAFLVEKTQSPHALTILDPKGNDPLTFQLHGKDLIQLLQSFSTSAVPLIPQRIAQVLAGDYSYIEQQLVALLNSPIKGDGIGMRISVWCTEETPFVSPKAVAEESDRYPAIEGISAGMYDEEICDIWGVRPAKAMENQAVSSTIPVLLISGSYDNATPVKWATDMTQRFPNSFHLIFKGWGHGPTTNWGEPCAMQAANAFFNNPSIKPELDCIAQLKTPIFKTE